MSQTSTKSPTRSSINLDRFQNQIESKLRQPYASMDLTKSILSSTTLKTNNKSTTSSTSQRMDQRLVANSHLSTTTAATSATTAAGEEIPSSNQEYIHCLSQIFPRLMKPIKLRVLISLLGFIQYYDDLSFQRSQKKGIDGNDNENDVDKNGDIRSFLHEMESLLTIVIKSTTKQDEWIKVTCNIIQYKLQIIQDQMSLSSSTSKESSSADTNNSKQIINVSTFKKGIDKIISSVTSNAQHAFDLRQEAEVKFMPADDEDDEEGTKLKEMETYIDSFQIGTDVQPYYTPSYYKLCSSKLIFHDSINSELNDRCDFILSKKAEEIMNPSKDDGDVVTSSSSSSGSNKWHILQMDEMNDKLKAEEEMKEMDAKRIANERKKNVTVNMKMKMNSRTPQQRPNTTTTRSSTANPTAATTTKTNGIDTASLMMRGRKMKPLPSSSSNTPTSLNKGQSGRNPITGRSRKAGFGRGAAASSIGGKSLSIPSSGMSRSNMAARALLRTRKKTPMGSNSGTASNGITMKGGNTSGSMLMKSKLGSSVSGGGAAMRNKTKMKIIDVNEVKGLKKEDEARQAKILEGETKESRKRKIMEKAAAKGLVSKNRWGDKRGVGGAMTSKSNGSETHNDDADVNDQGTNKRARVAS